MRVKRFFEGRCALAVVLAAAVFVVAAPVSALAADGGILVTVYDTTKGIEEREPLIGAQVVLSREGGDFREQGKITNIEGQARFPVVPEGSGYKLTVSAPGYGKVEQNVKVIAGSVVPVTVGLLEELKEVIDVRASERVVDLDDGGTQSLELSDEFIADLPVLGRNYENVLTLAPGVQDSDGDGNPNVHGARDRDFKATVDGVSNVDPLTGQRMSSINPDSIEEIEVVTSGASASQGGAVGGFANIIIKQGGNDFEGTFNFFFRDSVFDGDQAGGGDPQKFSLVQPSVFLAGPIVKDHLWYSVSHEYINQQVPVDVIGGNDFVQTYKAVRSFDKATWQINSQNKLSVQYNADPQSIDPAGADALTPVDSGFLFEFGGPTFTAKWTVPYSPTFFWESTLAFSDTGVGRDPLTRGLPNTCVDPAQVGPRTDPNLPFTYCQNRDDATTSGSYLIDFQDYRQRWTYKLDAEQYVSDWLGGSHEFKAGLLLEKVGYRRELTRRPFLDYRDVTVIGGTLPGSGERRPTQTVGQATQTLFTPASSNIGADGAYLAAYFEDQYQPFSNLSIQVGVRYSREELSADGFVPFDPAQENAQFNEGVSECIRTRCPTGSESCIRLATTACISGLAWKYFTVHPTDVEFAARGACFSAGAARAPNVPQCKLIQFAGQNWDQLKVREKTSYTMVNNNLAPRLSIAWDPKNDGKTNISGTFGKYFGNTFLLPLVIENGPDSYNQAWQLNNPGGWVQAGVNTTAFQIASVNRNLKSQVNQEWTLAVEREIAPETSLTVSYVHRKITGQLQDIDINHEAVLFSDITPEMQAYFMSVNDVGCKKIKDFADCTGRFGFKRPRRPNPFNQGNLVPSPDGVPDIRVNSPFFNSIMETGNYNSTQYQAYTLQIVRRYYQNWQLNFSYTWSTAVGQAEDFNQGLGDDPTIADDEFGFLSTDQRHVVKLNGRVFMPFWGGFRVGWVVSYESGLPYSIIESRQVVDFPMDLTGGTRISDANNLAFVSPRRLYPTGQRNDQRNAPVWDFNINFQKEFNIKDVRATMQFDVFNLLNDNTKFITRVQRTKSYEADGTVRIRDIPVLFNRIGRSFQVAVKANF